MTVRYALIEPSSNISANRRAPPDSAPEEFEATRIASARANRSAISWARKDTSTTSPASTTQGSISSMLQGLGIGGGASGASGGRRLIVFVIGGVTRSEMRAVHELSKRTGRDVLLGSTAVLKPAGFLSQLRSMGSAGQ
jgi:syntaxin-binding protein 1